MFSNEKITQAAAYLLNKAGGTMNYTAFLKLLYMADKKMLLEWGIPITYDDWYAMPYGPVLSGTYGLIKSPQNLAGFWGNHIATSGYDIRIISDPGGDLLSEAEEKALDGVFGDHGKKHWSALVDMTHDPEQFPEWSDPKGSSRLMTHREVLEVEGFPSDAIDEIVQNIETERGITRSLALDTKI